jgi:tetratricopeptide (TPR) repeat protein
MYAGQLLPLGRFAERDAIYQRELGLDPLNAQVLEDEVVGLFYEGQFARAVTSASALLQKDPKDDGTRKFLGYTEIMLGQNEAAEAAFKSIDSADWHQQMGLALIAARTGDSANAMSLFDKFTAKAPDTYYYQSAQLNAQLGDRDAAFASLDRGLQVKDPGVLWCKVDPFLAPLRGDVRFTALTTRLGLT